MAYIILFYTLGLSLPGLFLINPGSISYVLYQIVSLVAVTLLILINYLKYRDKISFSKPILYFLFTYTGLLTIAALYSTHLALADNRSLGSVAQFLLPPALCLTMLIGAGYSKLSQKEVNRILVIITLFIVFCAAYGVTIHYDTIVNLSSITNSYSADIKGFFANRNVFGYMLALGSACATFLFEKTRKITLLPVVVFLFASAILSMSRGAILLYIVFLATFILLKSKQKVIPATIMATTLIAAFTFFSGFAFVQDNIIRSDNGDTGRSELRSYGMQHFFNNNLLLGSGERAISSIESKFHHSSFHNLYIETLATQGVIGAISLVLCMLYIWKNIKLIKRYDKIYYAFFAALFFSYVVYCLIEALPLFYGTPNSAITTFILVLLPIFMINNLKSNKEYVPNEKSF